MTSPNITQEKLDELKAAAPNSPVENLEASESPTGKTEKEEGQIHKQMLLRLSSYVDSAKKLLGDPDGDTVDVTRWYPEALAAHAWTVDGGVYALAAVHDERETPIGITLRYVTTAERDELAKGSSMDGYFD